MADENNAQKKKKNKQTHIITVVKLIAWLLLSESSNIVFYEKILIEDTYSPLQRG